MTCPVNTVQCDSGYCIQQRMVCDGKNDCIHGEDELNCDTYICPGAHRCRGETNCVPKDQLCDGVPHCAQGDDESYCTATCPEGCECYGLVFFCRDMEFYLMLVDLPWYLRKIDLSNSFFAELAEMRGSNWTDVTFQRFSYMAELVLKNVGLWTLTNEIFLNLKNLLVLDLSYNMLTAVVNEPFADLQRLRTLNLRGNRIKNIESGVFAPLRDLNELHIQENLLQVYKLDLFSGLTTVTELHTDSYQLICIAQQEAGLKLRTFTPPKDAIASCDNLIENRELRIVLWVLGWFAFLGNILFIVRRLVKQKGALKKIKILDFTFLNLHIADAIMGVYCIIIASADEHYRGRYIENAEAWKQGGLCQFTGFLFTLAAEIPFVALPVAVFEECIYAFYDLQFRKKYGEKERPALPQWITLKMTAVILGVSWLALAFLALIPMFGIPYFGNKFYAKSTVCLPMYIAGDLPVGFEYSAFLFIIFNFCASVMLIVYYIFMFVVDTQREVEYDDEGEAIEEMAFSHRLFAVSFTNLSCWLPVVLFGMAGWDGSPVSVDLTPWAALIMIPINAAVNPLIYMIFPDKKRDLGGPAADKGKGGKPGAKPGQAKPGQGGAKPGQGAAKAVQGKAGQAWTKAIQAGAKPGQEGAKVGRGEGKAGQAWTKAIEAGAKVKDAGSAAKPKGAQAEGKGKDAGGAKADGSGTGAQGAAKSAAKGQTGGQAGAKNVAKEGGGASQDVAKVTSDNAQGQSADGKNDDVVPSNGGGDEAEYVNFGGKSLTAEAEVHRSEDKEDTIIDDSGVSGSKDKDDSVSVDSGVSGSKSSGSHEDDGSPQEEKPASAKVDGAKAGQPQDVDKVTRDAAAVDGKGGAKNGADTGKGPQEEAKAEPAKDVDKVV
ncbi:G-protein coupled receptor GRL101-like [Branchiostoma floridae]|uniref:G-protein coupled receptor GRL101-like n=1 Tax=Branchiostoma floridae TaxID=7739 RepID=A0A9J7HMP6_BRAFL|nr:G-protein coupled receptor GRL101-like [Branchiostoma floridae]